MSGFRLILNSPMQTARVEGVTSFVAADESGSFGILPGRARLVTLLRFGLARYRVGNGPWQYVALPGGLLYFADGELRISTRRYVVDEDYQRVSDQLQAALRDEEDELHAMRESVRQLEEAMLRRLWKQALA